MSRSHFYFHLKKAFGSRMDTEDCQTQGGAHLAILLNMKTCG
jgi:hypothetical protein